MDTRRAIIAFLITVSVVCVQKDFVFAQDNDSVTLFAVGDIMLSRTVAQRIKAKGTVYPFKKVRDFLKTGDVVFGNLENPIIAGRRIKPLEMSFRVDPGLEGELQKAGFTILSLANNHTPNFGQEGILSTIKLLTSVGILFVGAGKDADEAYAPVFFTKKGVRFAFLAYNDSSVVPRSYKATRVKAGTAFLDMKKMKTGIEEAKRNADIIIVSMHTGNEYTHQANTTQKKFAHAAIDFGADLVIGHHPHVVQNVERYNDGVIVYSLGNFIFDQMWSRKTREGVILQAIISKERVEDVDFIPILIDDYAQPRIVTGKEAKKILKPLGLSLTKPKDK